jgi:hypothetical protein
MLRLYSCRTPSSNTTPKHEFTTRSYSYSYSTSTCPPPPFPKKILHNHNFYHTGRRLRTPHRCTPATVWKIHSSVLDQNTTNNVDLRCENRTANRPARRETGLEMPCCPPSDLFWVQITQRYPNRLRFLNLPCPQSPCHAVIDPVFKEGFFPR